MLITGIKYSENHCSINEKLYLESLDCSWVLSNNLHGITCLLCIFPKAEKIRKIYVIMNKLMDDEKLEAILNNDRLNTSATN